MSFFIGLILVFYVLPFAIIAAMPGRRSLAVAAIFGTLLTGALWFDHMRHSGQESGFDELISRLKLWMMISGLASALVGRSLTLFIRRPSRRWRTLGVLAVAFLAAPAWIFGQYQYSGWKRRPPSAECGATRSFALRFGDIDLQIPNTPMTMVTANNDVFSLALPTNVRALCAVADRRRRGLEAQAVTLFVEKAARERSRWEVSKWLTGGCSHAPPVLKRLICTPDTPPEIDQITMYGNADYPKRVMGVGVAPIYEFFRRQKAAGKYPLDTATLRGGATVYPNGTWVMDDERSIVRCNSRPSKGFGCDVDIRLADGLHARTSFNVRGDDVEATFRRVEATILDLYREWSAAP